MFQVVTNASGDWMVVKNQLGEILFSGHSMSPFDIANLIENITIYGCETLEITDEQMGELT